MDKEFLFLIFWIFSNITSINSYTCKLLFKSQLKATTQTSIIVQYFSGMFYFYSYLTDFSYFPLKIVIGKLLNTVKSGQI